MSTRDVDDNCPNCGSSLQDREQYRESHNDDTIPVELKRCRHCGTFKCSMCDMGDDVPCMSCESD